MDEGSQYILSSLDHALDVLGLFFEREELTAAQAARALRTLWTPGTDRLTWA